MKMLVALTAVFTLAMLSPAIGAAQAPPPRLALSPPTPRLVLESSDDLEVRLETPLAEAPAVDLAAPIALTVVSAATAVAGLVLGYATVPREGGGGCLGSVCSAGPGPSGDEGLMIAGFTMAAVGIAALIPFAIWLGLERRRMRRLDQEIRSLQSSIALGFGPSGFLLRGTF